MKKYFNSILILIVYRFLLNIFVRLNNIKTIPNQYNIYTILIMPIIEEYVFRYCLLNIQKKYIDNEIMNILLNSLIFSIIHFDRTKLIPTFILGIILTKLMYKYNKLRICILIHSINNII